MVGGGRKRHTLDRQPNDLSRLRTARDQRLYFVTQLFVLAAGLSEKVRAIGLPERQRGFEEFLCAFLTLRVHQPW